jgi:hypothetical protein
MTTQSDPTNWRPPDGLGYSTLRPVRLSTQGIAMAVIGAVFLIGGPLLSYVIANQIKRDERNGELLARQGIETTAAITRLWRTGGKDDRHMVAYLFTAEDREWTGQVSAPRHIWVGLRTGTDLPIRFVPGQPSVNHPTGWPLSHSPSWLPWILLVAISWPALLFWFLIRRQERLLSEGRAAPGVITRLKRGDKQVVACYDFTLPSGEVMKGKSGTGRRPPDVGSRVCVLYNPENPRQNAIYPLQFVKLEQL